MSKEITITVRSGWTMLPVTLVLFAACPLLGVASGAAARFSDTDLRAIAPLLGFLSFADVILAFFVLGGHFTLQPNEARVLTLFGSYRGTVRESGFHWTNPFVRKDKLSLRTRNLNGEKLKVNDKHGSPIEIAMIVTWRVEDTAKASFDVESYEGYVAIQSESALRQLATSYAYDQGEGDEATLRGSVEEISQALQKELQQRLRPAGVIVEDARLSHLAYAPEIAQVMLRRQQADAVIAARQKIVHGAVTMVEMALTELAARQVVQLDDASRARLVSNLLVVLCGESEVQPVVTAGS